MIEFALLRVRTRKNILIYVTDGIDKCINGKDLGTGHKKSLNIVKKRY